jgi:hypothetical protein
MPNKEQNKTYSYAPSASQHFAQEVALRNVENTASSLPKEALIEALLVAYRLLFAAQEQSRELLFEKIQASSFLGQKPS